MDLSKLELKDEYRSDADNIVRDFYFPCLLNSTTYLRAVGYFTSASLSMAAKGLSKFIEAGGKMYLVASPFFDKDDLEAIERGIANQQKFLEDLLMVVSLRKERIEFETSFGTGFWVERARWHV